MVPYKKDSMTVPEYESSKNSICREKRQYRKLRKARSGPNELAHYSLSNLKFMIKPSNSAHKRVEMNGASLELVIEEQDSDSESEKEASEPDSVFSSAWSQHEGDRKEV